MNKNIKTLILEHPRDIRTDIGRTKIALSAVKQQITSVQMQAAQVHLDNTIVRSRTDAVKKKRLDRIGRRPEPAPA